MARLRALAQYQGKEEQERLEEGLLAEHRLRARIQVGTRLRAACVHACGLKAMHTGGHEVLMHGHQRTLCYV